MGVPLNDIASPVPEQGMSLSQFAKSDKQMRGRILGFTRHMVVWLGHNYCIVLIRLISNRYVEEVLEIFRRFRACLEPRIDPRCRRPPHSHLVLDRIFAFLETAERVVVRDRLANSKLKGVAEADRTSVFNREVKFHVWSELERLCDEIFFLEEQVKLVMSRTVGSQTIVDGFEECCARLNAIVPRFFNIPSHSDKDCSQFVRTEDMARRSYKIWKDFQLYDQPFTTIFE